LWNTGIQWKGRKKKRKKERKKEGVMGALWCSWLLFKRGVEVYKSMIETTFFHKSTQFSSQFGGKTFWWDGEKTPGPHHFFSLPPPNQTTIKMSVLHFSLLDFPSFLKSF